eukprot:5222118-Alexandrium_andersonii.AAC.1
MLRGGHWAWRDSEGLLMLRGGHLAWWDSGSPHAGLRALGMVGFRGFLMLRGGHWAWRDSE